MKESLDEQAPDYVASDVEELRTAGAYSKRAGEHSKEDRHMEAAADLTRALLRPGIDPQAKEKIEKKLVSTFEDHRVFLAAEAKAAAEKAALEARQKAEDDAIEEAKRRKEADEADWAAFTKSLEPPELGRVVFQAEVTLTKGGANGAPPEQVTQPSTPFILLLKPEPICDGNPCWPGSEPQTLGGTGAGARYPARGKRPT